jgi:hypothetical protein
MQHKRALYAEMREKRAAYADFEQSILNLYNRRLLTLELLDRIAGQYRPLKLDSAGSQRMLAHDGKNLYQVCIQLIDPAFPIPASGSNRDHEEYWEQELRMWEEIVRRRWNWRAYNANWRMQGEPVGG